MSNSSDLCSGFLNSTFARCLINTLLSLGAAALQILKEIVDTELLILDAELLSLLQHLIAADILAQKSQLYYNFILGQEAIIVNKINGLPLGLLDKNCTDWALLNGSISSIIQNQVLPPFNEILADLNRILSMQGELGAAKSATEALKTYFNNFADLLTELILEAQCRANA